MGCKDRFERRFAARPARAVAAALWLAAIAALSAESIAESIAGWLEPAVRLIVPQAAAADTSAGGGKTALTGQVVYEGLCFGCHRDGLGGAPKFGDEKAWAPRIAQGFDTLAKHAIEGFSGKTGKMPPRGGGTYLDVEVARAVAYMANKAGASFAEPATFAKN